MSEDGKYANWTLGTGSRQRVLDRELVLRRKSNHKDAGLLCGNVHGSAQNDHILS